MKKPTCRLVGYYRVSTREQGESKLGLEAQQEAVRRHAETTGCMLIGAYTEVESGNRHLNRPALAKALAECKAAKATLVIAKLDRLARNVAFTANLMESGIDFVACDNPYATPLTIHILAAVAEDESKRISQRTKDALAAYKARGGTLGGVRPGQRLSEEARQNGRAKGQETIQANATAAYYLIAREIVALKSHGLSLIAIAVELNVRGHVTRTGKPWNDVQVSRVLKRTQGVQE